MLHFSRAELASAFESLRQDFAAGAASTDPARRGPILLGIYAIECGLKLLLLQRRGVHNTSVLAEDDALFTHDLNRLLAEVGQPAAFRQGRALGSRTSVPAAQLHQLYRYGGRLERDHERGILAKVAEIVAFIRENQL